MKKYFKVLLSVILVICVAVSAFALTSVFSSAQAVAKGISTEFKGTNDFNYYVTLSSNTIQDTALQLVIYNDGEDTVLISKIENNGTSIRYTGFSQNMPVNPGDVTPIGISGTVNNNSVLIVTITYYKQGNPTATAETCSAYIFASDSQEYTAAESEGYIPFRPPAHGIGVVTTHTFSPVSTATLHYDDENENDKLEARNEIEIYVDGDRYTQWQDLNMSLSLFNYVEDYGWQIWRADLYRDHAYFDQLELEQTSQTGSMFFDGYGTDKDNPQIVSTFDGETKEGYFLQAGQNLTVSSVVTGKVPEEAESTFTLKLREYGQMGGFFGYGAIQTDEMHPQWNITVYNNNKKAIKDELAYLAGLGLNKSSYKSGWDAYESALKQAYVALGTNRIKAEGVQTALDNVIAAYNGLVRYAVVYTNHYFYQGNDDSNPVLIDQKIDMQVSNNASYAPDVLTNGTFTDYTFNRTNVVRNQMVAVDESNNYTQTINQYYWYVDTTALQATITIQENTVNTDEDGNEIYTADSWQNYADAAASARQVLNNTAAFQADLDAAKSALDAAHDALVKLDFDTAWLEEGIGWASNIIDNSYDDDFGRDWDTGELFASPYAQNLYANLVSAYNEAVEVTNDPDFTKAQADRVCAALWQAINNLRVKDETTKGLFQADNVRHADMDKYGYYKGLNDKLIENTGLRVVYNDILDNTAGNYRLNESDFTAESWYMLQNALYGNFAPDMWACASTEEPYPTYDGEDEMSVPAYSMLNNIWFLASQADYNACRDNLLDKVNHLEWIVDASALEEQTDLALAYNLSDYTNATAEPLRTALKQAQAMINKLEEPQYYGDAEAVTTEQANEMAEELAAAVAALQLKPYFETPTGGVSFGESGYIYGEPIGQTIETALSHLTVANNYEGVVITVKDSQGNLKGSADAVGTGYTVTLSDTAGEVFETHTFVVMGDVVGDAVVGENDFVLVYDYAFFEDSLTGVFKEAADVNDDGVIDLSDAVTIQEMYA